LMSEATRGIVWINTKADYNVSAITDELEKNGFSCKLEYVAAKDEERAVAAAKGCVAVVSQFEPWNERTLPQIRDDVKMIIRYGTGYDNIDVKAATSCGIPVFNVVGYGSAPVAEIALMHMLNINRFFAEGAYLARQDKWGTKKIECFELDGKTVGLFGAGNIGQTLARMLKGFHVKVIAYDVVRRQGAIDLGIEFVDSAEELFRQSDIVSIHVPLNDETAGIVGKKLISLMKPDAMLINTARGGLVNDADLLEALREKRIRAAGLDVLNQEPVRADNPYIQTENAFVTPHLGSFSNEAIVRAEEQLSRTIIEFFDGAYESEFPPNYLNPPAKV